MTQPPASLTEAIPRRVFAAALGQRMQQEVERQTGAVPLVRRRQMQPPRLDAQIDAGRDDVDVLSLEGHALGRLDKGKGCVA